ncbi:zinc-binding dehydrogenase [Pseudonocardia sp. RS11V-5]|uniref:zinc-binding dehydrogenase n=1 Tax=Pseudonocardia terrae TaxID=2905831 RepID=UPI001E3E94BC|nr:zinc-binding dehydrogenase [Pseudonocardia terrae]MCE3554666.1 zinc-binding dehydrogenase [Pseudonocardia terrae]
MPETMRAARFHEPGRPLATESLPRPEPGPGEVLLQVRAAGVCGSDVHFAIEGSPVGFVPITLGHEVAGTVAELGPDVDGALEDGLGVGARVVVNAVLTDGTCPQCLTGRSSICASRTLVGIHRDGGLAEFVAVPARALVPLPDEVPFDVGAIVTDAVATPFHALTDVARVRAGEAVAIVGVGGLGLHAVQIARLQGASPVIAVDPRASQRTRAAEVGADLVLEPGPGATEAVLAATGGAGADVAAEFVGRPESIAGAAELLRTGGRLVICGLGADPITLPPPTVFVRRELQVLGSYGFTTASIRSVLGLVTAGRLDLSRSITHRFPLDEADKALQTLHQKLGEPQRVVVLP